MQFYSFFYPLYVRYICSLYCDISILIFLEKAGHVLLFIIRSAQQNPHILAHIQLIQDTYISILYLYHLSVLKNSIHTQHEAFLGSLCLLFLYTFNKTKQNRIYRLYIWKMQHRILYFHKFGWKIWGQVASGKKLP